MIPIIMVITVEAGQKNKGDNGKLQCLSKTRNKHEHLVHFIAQAGIARHEVPQSQKVARAIEPRIDPMYNENESLGEKMKQLMLSKNFLCLSRRKLDGFSSAPPATNHKTEKFSLQYFNYFSVAWTSLNTTHNWNQPISQSYST